MEPMKLDVLIVLFAYSGNGGVASTIPELAIWLAHTNHKMATDKRIGRVAITTIADTPITMTRNRAVKIAQEQGFDALLMLDSDNEPDGYIKVDPDAKPFWDVGFELLYERKLAGKPTVVAAPYCGPPPHPARHNEAGEVPYLFQWLNNESDAAKPGLELHLLNRNEAAIMRGLHRVAAMPTGVCLFSLDAFEPLSKPYFHYEESEDGSEKLSTEDVVVTRNISLLWQEKIGENILFAACDSWALHHKTKKVGRPMVTPVDIVAQDFRQAVMDNIDSHDRLIDLHLQEKPHDSQHLVRATKDVMPADITEGLDKAGEGALDSSLKHIGKIEMSLQYRRINGRKVASVGHRTDDNDLGSLTQLVSFIASQRNGTPLRILEVGSWAGESALALHAGMTGEGGVIYCVDTWKGSGSDRTGELGDSLGHDELFAWFKRNVGELLNDVIRPIEGKSVEIAQGLDDPQHLDLVYIDAGHTYEECKADIDAWLPHIADDGVLCGHDYNDQFPGVKQAVDELYATTGKPVRTIGTSNVWFIPKRELIAAAQQPAAEQEVEDAIA